MDAGERNRGSEHGSASSGQSGGGWVRSWENFMQRLRQRDPQAIAIAAAGVLGLIVLIYLTTVGRGPALAPGPAPEIPAAVSEGPDREPQLTVFFHTVDRQVEMGMEDYLLGVVAAEMSPDWPMAALEAQAIIARTFTLQRIAATGGVPERDSHASTNHEEFQAYDSARINDRVQEAVARTRGQVIAFDGRFARTWFHAYSGGQTETPRDGLGYEDEVPYVPSISDQDFDDDIPDDVRHWSMTVPAETLAAAVSTITGGDPGTPDEVSIADRTPSGRAETISVNGQKVNALDLRRELGSDEFKSTLIDEIAVADAEVTFSGRGFGHGVGLSQWGARVMAERGASPEEIINKYYSNVYIVTIWD